ncbi:MAG: ABC transporter permease [Acidimicrobiaceae bacterium]|nr:ABC transporter permease [Acidimicrobiaceae bacterium]
MTWLTDPVDWWITPFVDNPFLRDALWAALLTVVCTSVIGTWVVLRGLSFLGDALAHGVLPGIAIAFVIGTSTTLGALVAAIVMVGGIQLIRTASPLPDDASIGVLFVGFLALAVVVMSSRAGGGSGDLTRFLFGSINAIDTAGLRRLLIVAVITVVGVAVLHRALVVGTFDEVQARLLGFRPRLTHFALLVLLALAIVASFETVGSLLVFAFLIAPPATASLVFRRVPTIMVGAVGIGAIGSVIGLLVSYHAATATGATMALTTVAIFLVGLLVSSADRLRRAI